MKDKEIRTRFYNVNKRMGEFENKLGRIEDEHRNSIDGVLELVNIRLSKATKSSLKAITDMFKKQAPQDWVWVSVDENGLVKKWLPSDRLRWVVDYWTNGGFQGWLERGGTIKGLQPGMLCKAKKVPSLKPWEDSNWYYKILSVEQCNLPIKVDWRKCKYEPEHDPTDCIHPDVEKTNLVETCPFRYLDSGCRKAPYLPDTDIMITCEFEEKLKEPVGIGGSGYPGQPQSKKLIIEHEEKKEKDLFCPKCRIELGFNKGVLLPKPKHVEHEEKEEPVFSNEEASIVLGVKIAKEIRKALHKALGVPYPKHQPKLITIDVLKERGVNCEETLEEFEKVFPTGCTYEALYSVIELRRRCWATPSLEQLRFWAKWIENNLADFKDLA